MVNGIMGIGPWQIVLVVVLVLLLFPKRLSGLGSSLGKALKDFKSTVGDDESKNTDKNLLDKKS